MTLFDFGPEQTVWQDISALVSMVHGHCMFGCADYRSTYSSVKSVYYILCNSVTFSQAYCNFVSRHYKHKTQKETQFE